MTRKSTIIAIGILAVMTVLFFVMMASGLDLRAPEPTVSPDFVPPAADEEPVDEKEPDELLFSIGRHVLKEEQPLYIISVFGEGDIYYTTDGTEPDEKSEKYDPDSGIQLTSHRNMKCNLVSAKIRYRDGSWSRTYTDSWFVGRIADERYNTPIISISSDPHGLFDYFDGIMVEGAIRDEYKESHPHSEINPASPANYNQRGMESERAAHVTMYLEDGTEIVNQNIGIRVNGGWSRDHRMKSLRLTARYDYDYTNKFDLELFTGVHDAVGPDNTYVRSQQRVTLRNNANDAWGTCLREEAIALGARAAGFADVQSARPVSVYLNGDYYGFMWMHENFDSEFFENRYGKYEGYFEILEGGEADKKCDEDSETSKAALAEWREIIKSAKKDLTDDIYFLDLIEKLDINDYLLYYAIEIYVGNTDWPQNNHKIYRYYAAEGEEYRPGTVFDGRWRMLLFDTEFGFGLAGNEQIDSLGRVLNRSDGGYSPLFTSLMRREDCRQRFVNIVTDLWNGAYNMYYFSDLISDLARQRFNELDYSSGSKYSATSSSSNATSQVTNMKNVVEARAKRMQRLLEKYLDETKTVFTVEYDPGEIRSTVKMNGWTVRKYESEAGTVSRRN
nr:CotH kinase family protein [Clostridiales bacterium]